MKTWNIKVREEVEYWVSVEADTLDEAKSKAEQTTSDDSSTVFGASRTAIDHELLFNNSND